MVLNTLLIHAYLRIWFFFQISHAKVVMQSVPSYNVTWKNGLAGVTKVETGLKRCEISQATCTYLGPEWTRNRMASKLNIVKKTIVFRFWGGGGRPPPHTGLEAGRIGSSHHPQPFWIQKYFNNPGQVFFNEFSKSYSWDPYFLGGFGGWGSEFWSDSADFGINRFVSKF
jgi:hypothetical protein